MEWKQEAVFAAVEHALKGITLVAPMFENDGIGAHIKYEAMELALDAALRAQGVVAVFDKEPVAL